MVIKFDEDYYEMLVRERKCGPYPFESINFDLGDLKKEDLKHLWLYQVNASKFCDSFLNNEKVIATTGFGMTGVPHVGTITQIFKAIQLQKIGIPVQIVLGDLDAYCGKAVDLSYVCNLVSKYKDFILRLGFDDKPPNVIRTQYDALEVLRTLYLTGYYLTDDMFEDAKEDIHDYYSKYQKIDKEMTYRIKLSLNLMVADFVDLYLNGGYKSVLVFLGIDEYKYVGLAMDILKKIQKNNIFVDLNLASLFSKTMKGFGGHPKMGKSLPGSGIDVSMSFSEIETIIMCNAAKKCRNLEDDITVFQMMSFINNDFNFQQIEEIYKKGGVKWQQLKIEYVSFLFRLFKKWNN